ncbi:MAG TPA: NlpC/P60 family protein [Mycobacteriales bacterium]|nr:NlpC/P60 family protein [Mycobacteriales bacterium]
MAAVLPATAGAAPAASIGQVRAQIAALTVQEEQFTEAYDRSQVELAAAEQRVRELQDRVTRQLAATTKARAGIAALVSAAYRSGGFGQEMSVLTSSDPASFLTQASDLEQISRNQTAALDAFVSTLAELTQAQADVRHATEVQAWQTRQIAAARGRIESTITAERALLSRLTAAQQAAVAPVAASRSEARAPLSFNIPVDGRAAIAVRFAYAQIGKPYQWGGSGPDSYDCSGLTMQAWAAAGVALDHYAASQQSSTTPVSGGNLEPGDLIFFGYPAYHVGIYIGNGQMINALHSGTNVEIDSISGYTDAGRP